MTFKIESLSTIDEESSDGTAASTSSNESSENTNIDERRKILKGTKIEVGVRACQRGNVEMIKCLLNAKSIHVDQLDDERCTLMHWAAINNQVEIIRILISKKANVNILGGVVRSTPLHWACHVGNFRAVVELVKNGADASIRNGYHETALHVAATSGNSIVIAYLLVKFDAIKDWRDRDGKSALMIAAKNSYGMFPIRIFVKCEVYLDFFDDLKKETALHICAKRKNFMGVIELLTDGADDTLLDRNGNLAIEHFGFGARKDIGNYVNDQIKLQYGNLIDKILTRWFAKRAVSAVLNAFFITLSFLLFKFVHFAAGFVFNIVCFVACSCYIRKRQFQELYWFLCSYIVTFGATEFLVMIFWTNGIISWSILLPMAVLFTTSAVLFFVIMFSKKGIIPKSEDPFDEFVRNVENKPIEKYCFTCWVPKPLKSHHCSVCDKCIEEFDHHCPWLNKCIHRKNMKTFIGFILTAMIFSHFYTCIIAYYVWNILENNDAGYLVVENGFILSILIVSIMNSIGASCIFWSQLSLISRETTTIENLRRSRMMSSSTKSPSEQEQERLTLAKRIKNVWKFLCS